MKTVEEILDDLEERINEERRHSAELEASSSEELRARLAKATGELKNFISAFDEYFDMRGGYPNPQRASDAKQAMFSAAIQARAALAEIEGE